MAEEMRFGSVYQRGKKKKNGDGRWVADLILGEKGNGKPDVKSFYGVSRAEAVDKRQTFYNDVRDGLNADAGRDTLGKYLASWVEGLRDLATNTVNFYKAHVELHLVPILGQVKLCRFDADNVEFLYDELTRREVSAALQRHIGTTLSTACKEAVKRKKLSFNPVSLVRKPRAVKPQIGHYTVEELGQLLRAAKEDKFYALYVLAATTGMRQGEIFGLAWEDLHLEEGFLTVVHSLEEANGEVALKDTKTGYGRREELDPDTVTALKEHREWMLRRGTYGGCPVFCGLHGGFLYKAHFRQRSWIPTVERAGLRYLHFHCLRHSVASAMMAMGEQVKVIQERLGHSSIQTTMDKYGHLHQGLHKEAAHRLGAAINKAAAVVNLGVVQVPA
jgi:integrase